MTMTIWHGVKIALFVTSIVGGSLTVLVAAIIGLFNLARTKPNLAAVLASVGGFIILFVMSLIAVFSP